MSKPNINIACIDARTDLFEILAGARSLDELRAIEPVAQEVRTKYMDELMNVDARELAIHRRMSRMNYSRRCAEASAAQVYRKRGLPLAPGMEIGSLVRWDILRYVFILNDAPQLASRCSAAI